MARINLLHPLLIALGLRSLHLLLPHTFFQPDEFWQALEPAHPYVFGNGYLTWEWRDLPPLQNPWTAPESLVSILGPEWAATAEQAWDTWVVQGRMRSWIWVSVFVWLYKGLRVLGLEGTEWLVRFV